MTSIAKQLRYNLGLDVETVCRETGITHNTLHDIEKQRRDSRPGTLKRVADFYGVTVMELIADWDDNDPPLTKAAMAYSERFSDWLAEPSVANEVARLDARDAL